MNQEILAEFKKEFPHVYEWKDEAGTIYKDHAHKGKVSIFVVEGGVTFTFSETGETKTINAGERFDVPAGVHHTAIVSKNGCSYIIGEMIDGDS